MDAARRLDWKRPLWQSDDGEVHCVYCNGMTAADDNGFIEFGHAIDCPTLALPKIVAALEAAQVVARDAYYSGDADAIVVDDDDINALRAALGAS